MLISHTLERAKKHLKGKDSNNLVAEGNKNKSIITPVKKVKQISEYLQNNNSEKTLKR
jgi:hypothetical protein